MLISEVKSKPFSNNYFESLFNAYLTDRTAIYMLPRFITLISIFNPFNTKS